MQYDLILKNVARHISLDLQEEEYFISILEIEEIPKKGMILKEGQLCKYIYFVNSGALRAFYMDPEAKESTVMFAIPQWWITDMACFINEGPAMLFIEAIENSCVLRLSKSELEKLYVRVPKFEKFFRIIMQNAYIREQLRVIQNLSLTAEERYTNFLQKYPLISSQVTQKQIASYLGITPEFLSLVRARRSRS